MGRSVLLVETFVKIMGRLVLLIETFSKLMGRLPLLIETFVKIMGKLPFSVETFVKIMAAFTVWVAALPFFMETFTVWVARFVLFGATLLFFLKCLVKMILNYAVCCIAVWVCGKNKDNFWVIGVLLISFAAMCIMGDKFLRQIYGNIFNMQGVGEKTLFLQKIFK